MAPKIFLMAAAKKLALSGGVKAEVKKEEAKDFKLEPLPELEKDAPAPAKKKLTTPVTTSDYDTTLNVFVSAGGSILSALSDDAFQYLLAGARADGGVKKGRYMFEVKIIEAHNSNAAVPAQSLKVGFSKKSSPLLMGETADSVCFDNQGGFTSSCTREVSPAMKFAKHDVVALVLNLDSSSDNANTVSMFKNGVRVCTPKKLPESLKGVALFPTFTFKNVTIAVNYSALSWEKLPFKCWTFADAGADDFEMTAAVRPKDGVYNMVLPVGLPESGFYDFCDMFLKQNPEYVELSTRKIAAWCAQSGHKCSGTSSSVDKPNLSYGVPGIEDPSFQKLVKFMAATIAKRHVLVADLQGNLSSEQRTSYLSSFPGPHKKLAKVIMGEPSANFKDYVLAILKEAKKKDAIEKHEMEKKKANADRIKKLEMLKKTRALEKQKKETIKRKLKMEKEKKRAAKAAVKARKAAEKLRKAEARAKLFETNPEAAAQLPDVEEEEEPPEEEEEEDVKSEPEEEKVDTEMLELEKEIEIPMPDVEDLTEDEKKTVFSPKDLPDLTAEVITANFQKFSIPTKDDGFDDIQFEWQKKPSAETVLKDYILNKKMTERVDSITPSDWFKEKLEAWNSQRNEFKEKMQEYRAKQEEEKAEKEKENVEKNGEAGEEEKEVEEEPDIDACTDIHDANGKALPLYLNFGIEQWALLNLRFEINLLIHAFKKDLNDDEHPGILEEHFAFYFQKYYKRPFNPEHYGVQSLEDVFTLFGTKCPFLINEKKFLETLLPEDFEAVEPMKEIEQDRRERKRMVEAGDDMSILSFNGPAMRVALGSAWMMRGPKKRTGPPFGLFGGPAKRMKDGSFKVTWKPWKTYSGISLGTDA